MDVVQKTVLALLRPGRGNDRYELPATAEPLLRSTLRQALLGDDADVEVGGLVLLIEELKHELASPNAARLLIQIVRQTPLALAIVKAHYRTPEQDPLALPPPASTQVPTQTQAQVLVAPPAPPEPPAGVVDAEGLSATDEHPTKELTQFPAARPEHAPRRPRAPRVDFSVLTQPELEAHRPAPRPEVRRSSTHPRPDPALSPRRAS